MIATMRKTALAFACAAMLSSSLVMPTLAQPRPAKTSAIPVANERLWLGSAWYPEQWPESAWPEDLRLMKASGANVVRIGEYAWSRMEPSEGQYDFGWLVRAVRLAAKYDIKVVVGTPTDTPPAWLTEKYPDTLQVDGTGKRLGHGGRLCGRGSTSRPSTST